MKLKRYRSDSDVKDYTKEATVPGEDFYKNMLNDYSYKSNFLKINNIRLTLKDSTLEYESEIVSILNFFIGRTSLCDRGINNDKWHFGKENKILMGRP